MTHFAPRTHPAQTAMRAWADTQPDDIWSRIERARTLGAAKDPRYYVLHAGLCQTLPPSGDWARWATDVALASGWGAWRMTQGVYRYDPAVYEAIRATPVDRIPVDVLDHLPEWAVYIETPDFAPALTGGRPVQGVLAWRNRIMEDGMDVLMLVLLAGRHEGIDYDREVLVLPLADTLDETIARRVAEAEETERLMGLPSGGESESAALREALPPILSLLLYLCSEEPDITGRHGTPGNPAPKRNRRDGWRLFPAEGLRPWDVGTRLGAALRQSYHAAETGQTEIDPETGRARPRAHIRRAHWHTFLSGVGRSERRLKWLPPIAINADDPDCLPTTVWKIRP